MDGAMFAEKYVDYVLSLASQQGMTQIEFASAVWSNMTRESANTTISAVKKKNGRGKRQYLRVQDAIKMAQVVGREYPSLCFEVWEKLKLEMASSAASGQVPPKTPGKVNAIVAVE